MSKSSVQPKPEPDCQPTCPFPPVAGKATGPPDQPFLQLNLVKSFLRPRPTSLAPGYPGPGGHVTVHPTPLIWAAPHTVGSISGCWAGTGLASFSDRGLQSIGSARPSPSALSRLAANPFGTGPSELEPARLPRVLIKRERGDGGGGKGPQRAAPNSLQDYPKDQGGPGAGPQRPESLRGPTPSPLVLRQDCPDAQPLSSAARPMGWEVGPAMCSALTGWVWRRQAPALSRRRASL